MSIKDEVSLEFQIIHNRFEVGRSIGKGSFGEVFEAHDRLTGKQVAVKIEHRIKSNYQLKNEHNVYQIISGGPGISSAIHYGSTDTFDYLVLDLLGPSLENLFNYCRRKFSLKTVLMLGEQMIRRIEYLHQMSHVHRDLKPDNFVIDSKNGIEVYLIDFGLARRFCQVIDNEVQHVKFERVQSFTGTARYASIGAQQQYTTSRKDDLESLAYILVYFLRSRLPWQQVPKASPTGITPKQRKERILEIKMSTKVSDICKGIPTEFQSFIRYCRNLKFDDAPCYGYLRRLLQVQFDRSMFVRDWIYDWNETNEKKNKKSRPSREHCFQMLFFLLILMN